MRYLLFCFDDYYPSGGWSDFVDGYATLADALEGAARANRDRWQIVDTETWKIVKEHKGLEG